MGNPLFLQPGHQVTSENRYLFRSPLLDPKQQVLGYKLAWQQGQDSTRQPPGDVVPLLSLVAEGVRDLKTGLVFMDASAVALTDETLQGLSPATTVLVLTRNDLDSAGRPCGVQALRERGFGVAVRDIDLAFLKTSSALLSRVSHVAIDFDHPDLQAICSYAGDARSRLTVAVEGIRSWQEFDTCAALGASGFFGDICLAPRPVKATAKLGPQALQILQLMQMVQGNADIRHVEKVLKSDLTLSYKLLRYINSAGFGLEVEIESPRHAVAMLGYAPLFRWLLLLLARTNTSGFSPALMQAAMIRGRFAELLGQGALSRREAENLFVVGMFSFLDRLLGIPVQEVLGQLELPKPVSEALTSREGVYEPILALAESTEREDGCAQALAQALSMTAPQVNKAHLAALAWAQSIKL